MREIISIHIGQAGVKSGEACWRLYCQEYGIEPSGELIEGNSLLQSKTDDYVKHWFSEGETGRYTPRSLFVDVGKESMNQLRTGLFRHLYKPEQLLSSPHPEAASYAKGRYTLGSSLINETMERIRTLTEDCSSLQGFLISHSIGGGTGSGFASLLLERMHAEYPRSLKLDFCIYPSFSSSFNPYENVVSPYNCVLSTPSLLEYTNAVFAMENQASFDICQRKLKIERPTYSDLNRQIAEGIGALTTSMRLGGACTLTECDRLIPFPTIHFLFSSYSSWTARVASDGPSHLSATEITKKVFEPENMSVAFNARKGKYMACSLMYKGNVVGKEVCTAICDVKQEKEVRFVDWSPCGFRVGITSLSSTACAVDGAEFPLPVRSCAMVGSNTEIKEIFLPFHRRFDELYEKRSFLSSLLEEGMEESEIQEAINQLKQVEADYDEICADEGEDID